MFVILNSYKEYFNIPVAHLNLESHLTDFDSVAKYVSYTHPICSQPSLLQTTADSSQLDGHRGQGGRPISISLSLSHAHAHARTLIHSHHEGSFALPAPELVFEGFEADTCVKQHSRSNLTSICQVFHKWL